MAIIASLIPDKSKHIKIVRIWIKYEVHLDKTIKNNGQKYALARFKDAYGFLRNYTLNLESLPLSFTKVDKRGIPKTLWPLRPLMKGGRNEHRLALCISRCYEKIYLPIDYCTESIESPTRKRWDDSETTKYFKQFLEQFSSKYPWYLGTLVTHDPIHPKVFTTTGHGPNGPSVAFSHLDARAVIDDDELYSSIKKFNNVLRQSWITRWMEKHASYVTPNTEYLNGRLGFTSEPGGKTRVFAIGDYWSQTSLKVIQDSLYNTLKQISTDCTKDQDKGFKTLVKESLGKPTYCFDLSSASDRIPAEMQVFRLNLMKEGLGDAWLSIMTRRNFYIKERNKFVRWKVGQPLGLLSSFPSFSLWHHDIIQYSYNIQRIENGKPLRFFKDYRLLGDDVVIFNKEVAVTYQQILNEIGIPINMSKSVIGDENNSQIEFTKRLALNGLEMSSVKYNIQSKDKQVYLLDLVDILLTRDIIPDTGHHGLCDYLSSIGNNTISMMIWFRSTSPHPYRVNEAVLIDRLTLANMVKEKRHQNMRKKSEEVTLINNDIPLNELYPSSSLPRSDQALGLSGHFNNDALELHPIVWAINQVGLDLCDKLTILWDEAEEISPVEYLPNPSLKAYFHARKNKNIYLSKIIIDSFNTLLNETKDVK
jgi:hypothetical protein